MISRKEAMRQGLQRYFTGKPCPHGHIADRYTKTWQCVECVKSYAPAWMKAHPEKTAESGKRYRARNHEKVKVWKSESQKRNRESANARGRKYLEANREKVRAVTAAWQKANPEKASAKTMRRHADKLRRTPKWADHDAINGMYELCAVFRGVGLDLHVDHVIPLRGKYVSGLHVPENLQLLHSQSNRSKSNHF